MDVVAYGMIFTMIVTLGRGDINGILRKLPERSLVAEEMLERCLRTVADRHNNSELVLIVRDGNLDLSRFVKFWTKMTLNDDVKLGTSLMIRVVRHRNNIPAALRRTHWTRHTSFVIVERRTPGSDAFFVDGEHQEIGFKVVRNHEILMDFRQLVMRSRMREDVELRDIFRYFWHFRVTNVVALVPRKTNVYIYTYFPFTERNCPEEMEIVLVDVWSSVTGRFYSGNDLYPDKVKNVFGCPLNVSLISSPPGVMAEKGTIDGIEGEMLKFLFASFNATPKFHFVNPLDVSMNDSDTALNYLLESVKTGESEFGAGFLIPTSAYTGTTDDIHVGISLCLTWAVPNRMEIGGAVMPIIDTFTLPVWVIVFLTCITCSVINWCLLRKSRRNFTNSVFQIVAVVLGKPVRIPPDKPSKAFLMFFVWCSIILGSAFQAGLGSNNIISGSPPKFESTKDIVESGLEITGVESTVRLFAEDIKLIRNNGRYVHVEPMEIHNALVKVAFERRTAYVGLRLAIVYYIQFLYPELTDHVSVYKSCLVNYQPFFALRKNSPFTPRTRHFVGSLIEGGFKVKLEGKYLARLMKTRRRGRRVMSKGDALVRGSFFILVVGLLTSGVAFIAESLFYHIQRRIRILERRLAKHE